MEFVVKSIKETFSSQYRVAFHAIMVKMPRDAYAHWLFYSPVRFFVSRVHSMVYNPMYIKIHQK
jgi:hypothetical protein